MEDEVAGLIVAPISKGLTAKSHQGHRFIIIVIVNEVQGKRSATETVKNVDRVLYEYH